MTVEMPTRQLARVHALVVGKLPLGMDAVLSIAGISALGDIVIKSSSEVIEHWADVLGRIRW